MELNQQLTTGSATFIQVCGFMPKPRYKISNWKQNNQSLINRGLLTFWIDEEAISSWKQEKQNKSVI